MNRLKKLAFRISGVTSMDMAVVSSMFENPRRNRTDTRILRFQRGERDCDDPDQLIRPNSPSRSVGLVISSSFLMRYRSVKKTKRPPKKGGPTQYNGGRDILGVNALSSTLRTKLAQQTHPPEGKLT